MKKRKKQSEKLIEFLLNEHEGSSDRGIFHIDYGFKFSLLEIPKTNNKEKEKENVRTTVNNTVENTNNN